MNVTDKGFLHVYTCECCGRAIYKGDMYLEKSPQRNGNSQRGAQINKDNKMLAKK